MKQERKNIIEKEKTDYEVVEIEVLPEKTTCPDCGNLTYEGLEYCHQCGAQLHIY